MTPAGSLKHTDGRKVYYRTTDKNTGKQKWHPVPGLVITKSGMWLDIDKFVWTPATKAGDVIQGLYTKRAK